MLGSGDTTIRANQFEQLHEPSPLWQEGRLYLPDTAPLQGTLYLQLLYFGRHKSKSTLVLRIVSPHLGQHSPSLV